MGTNGIDGCTSTFMGQCAVTKDKLCFLIVGDLSFFYDMNAIWNKSLQKNMRILLVNNNGSGLLRNHNLKAITSVHNTVAKGWVEETGFEYMSANTREEFTEKLKYFMSDKPKNALFFEVFCK
jgi:2-succinyl-5-enolpyruvyl-6-hydroxy-3-cyclohexene-1-carboxylate synthase